MPKSERMHSVAGTVPRTVINETIHLEGAAPEAKLLTKLKEAAGAKTLA
jgi:hypothetical protein